MMTPSRKRLSFSPERLTLAGQTHTVDSRAARTFFILGNTVVWSHAPHQQIISCFRMMEGPQDRKTPREYGVRFAGTLSDSEFHAFRSSLTGVLGDNRRRNKAGRIWIGVPGEDGAPLTVISFWARRRPINDGDIQLLRRAFGVECPVWVDWIDRARARRFDP